MRSAHAFGCVVIIVHHCGVDATRPRGHTSLIGAVDAQLAVKRDAAENVVVTVERMKDGPEGDSLVSKLEAVDVGVDIDGDPITSCVVVPVDGAAVRTATTRKLSDRQKLALDALADCAVDHGEPPPADFRTAGRPARDQASPIGATSSTRAVYSIGRPRARARTSAGSKIACKPEGSSANATGWCGERCLSAEIGGPLWRANRKTFARSELFCF